ncbi:hypothetical protein K469DRAFT_719749 [Zopfia rhizophila CBS 207.26]|uniref:Uncharacterized protein n=1 Tax=Zopfia rhizophila CBS 207.26 TaxID=1314779 RepID=A0A6A6DH11_9PEZI|nr:hypothetical protein K469DRAFT_719749 [Zopfia rhizophila CBS 207.26]
MASHIGIDASCIPPQPSRLVYILAPGTLVRIGPDLDGALTSVIASLRAAFHGTQGKARHLATTYSLANITIVMDYFESGEKIQLQVLRLRLQGNRLVGCRDQGSELLNRINNQLQSIQHHQPNIQTPFKCMEDWRGFGPKDYHIYTEMAKASTSTDNWRKFKATFHQRR